MGLIAKNEFKKELAPEGTQLGICIWAIDLGWQHNEHWNKDQQKILIAWELPDCIMPDSDKPFMISREFTNVLTENSHLRPFLESWRGKAFTEEECLAGFDIRKLLGQWGYLSIVHSEDGRYANATTIMGLPPDVKKVTMKRKSLNEWRTLDLDNFDQKEFDALPRWVQEKIMKSQEYQKMTGNWEPSDEDIDDIDEDEFTGGTGGPNDPSDIPFEPSKI